MKSFTQKFCSLNRVSLLFVTTRKPIATCVDKNESKTKDCIKNGDERFPKRFLTRYRHGDQNDVHASNVRYSVFQTPIAARV